MTEPSAGSNKTRLHIGFTFPRPSSLQVDYGFECTRAYIEVSVFNRNEPFAGDLLALRLSLSMSERVAGWCDWLLPDRREKYLKGWCSRPRHEEEADTTPDEGD
jgi:hypothetical protein